jgi:hypothetical protein
MDGVSLVDIASNFSAFGITGVLAVLCWGSIKDNQKTLAAYKQDMMEWRRMYENNVELVKKSNDLAGDLKEIIIMNTQAFTKLEETIKHLEIKK